MHELWITRLLNEVLPGPATAVRSLLSVPAADASRPWPNYMAMEVLVVLILVAIPLVLRARASVEKPGTFQQLFEVIFEFLDDLARDIIGHDSRRYLPLFGTLFLFILCSNLIGIIPSFESPTMFPPVPLGCAMLSFLFYNYHGVRVQGPLRYLAHFCGPMLLLAPFLFFIEIISHCIRPVSLTIRLFANMLAGEQVTVSFMALVPFGVPVILMGLHVFVSLVQAFIFTILSMLYVGGAVEQEH